MCCEICPRFVACEEEGHLNDLCCVSCSDYKSCHQDSDSEEEDLDGSKDDF